MVVGKLLGGLVTHSIPAGEARTLKTHSGETLFQALSLVSLVSLILNIIVADQNLTLTNLPPHQVVPLVRQTSNFGHSLGGSGRTL